MQSRPLHEVCCATKAILFNVCLSDADLRTLGVWDERPGHLGFSAALRGRALLHSACHDRSAAARRVADLFDLRFLDALARVRASEPEELRREVDRWILHPDGDALPGLLWALCSDARAPVHALGTRLCHEAVAVACRALVESVPAPRPDPSPAPIHPR